MALSAAHAIATGLGPDTGANSEPAGFPFGWQSLGVPAMKISQIAALKPLSEAWATADLDWDATASPTSLGADRTPYVAIAPVHGATRTALYFDLHVDKIKTEDWVVY